MVPELSSKKYLAICIVFLRVLAGSLVYFAVRHKVLSLLVWLDTLGPWGPTLFMLFDMLVVLFIVPGFGLIMALGGGFIFGVLTGTVYVIVGTMLGAAFGFTIARHFFGERASKFILARSKLKVLEHEFTREGWKIVLLTNLVPFFPFRLSNYFYGLMHFSLGDFIIGVFFGIMPFTITNVYVGPLAANLATLGERNASRSAAAISISLMQASPLATESVSSPVLTCEETAATWWRRHRCIRPGNLIAVTVVF